MPETGENSQITENDIDAFFKVISLHSKQTDYTSPQLIQQISISYLLYLSNLVNPSISFTSVRLNQLVDRLTKLINDKFFDNKTDSEGRKIADIANRIRDDMKDNSTLTKTMFEETGYGEDYIDTLRQIKNEDMEIELSRQSRNSTEFHAIRKSIIDAIKSANQQFRAKNYYWVAQSFLAVINKTTEIPAAEINKTDAEYLERAQIGLFNLYSKYLLAKIPTAEHLMGHIINGTAIVRNLLNSDLVISDNIIGKIQRIIYDDWMKYGFKQILNDQPESAFIAFDKAYEAIEKIPPEDLMRADIEVIMGFKNTLMLSLLNCSSDLIKKNQYKTAAEIQLYLIKEIGKTTAPLPNTLLKTLYCCLDNYTLLVKKHFNLLFPFDSLEKEMNFMEKGLKLFQAVETYYAEQIPPIYRLALMMTMGVAYGEYADKIYPAKNTDEKIFQLYELSDQLLLKSASVNNSLSQGRAELNQLGRANVYLTESINFKNNKNYIEATKSLEIYSEKIAQMHHAKTAEIMINCKIELMSLHLLVVNEMILQGQIEAANMGLDKVLKLITEMDKVTLHDETKKNTYLNLQEQYLTLNTRLENVSDLIDCIDEYFELTISSGITFFKDNSSKSESAFMIDTDDISDILDQIRSDFSDATLTKAKTLIDEYRGDAKIKSLFSDISSCITEILEEKNPEQKPSLK